MITAQIKQMLISSAIIPKANWTLGFDVNYDTKIIQIPQPLPTESRKQESGTLPYHGVPDFRFHFTLAGWQGIVAAPVTQEQGGVAAVVNGVTRVIR